MRSFSILLRTVLRFFNYCEKGHDLTACRRQESIPAGQALSLRARRAGVLQSTSARLWVTLSSAAEDASVRGGDHFLEPSEGLALAAGQAVVLESWSAGAGGSFSWEPAANVRAGASRAEPQPAGFTGGAARPASPVRSLAAWPAPFAAVPAWCCCAPPQRSGSSAS